MAGEDAKRFPFVGFEGERYFGKHYIVDFGQLRAGVSWIDQTGCYRVFTWGTGWGSPGGDAVDELSVLAILHDLKNTYGGNSG